MSNLTEQKIINSNSVFDTHYLDSKAMYMYFFSKVPCLSFVNNIDGEKAFEAFKEKYSSLVASVHSYRFFERKKQKVVFRDTLVVLNNNCLLEFDVRYCELLHDHKDEQFVIQLVEFLKTFKEKQRRKPLEINLIVKNGNYLELKSMEIKRTKLDLGLFYENDFGQVDDIIQKRLNKYNDKGLVLLHGLPGTGKTTYLRYLIGKIKKRILFLPPEIAGNLADPEFLELLIDNPNSVLIIEDAENIIMDRRYSSKSSVSNLLNISDGLLSDFLNVQLICTFNSPLTMVDQALMRKGRLIAKYEFGKLSITKAQRLSNHLGFNSIIHQPMTIAEIANPHEKEYKSERIEVIGFKRELIEN